MKMPSNPSKETLNAALQECDRLAAIYLQSLLPHLNDPQILRRLWLDNPEIVPSCREVIDHRKQLTQLLENV
jgi:hypothetical protein